MVMDKAKFKRQICTYCLTAIGSLHAIDKACPYCDGTGVLRIPKYEPPAPEQALEEPHDR